MTASEQTALKIAHTVAKVTREHQLTSAVICPPWIIHVGPDGIAIYERMPDDWVRILPGLKLSTK